MVSFRMNAQSPTARQLLQTVASRLRESGVDTPILDAEVMFAEASGKPRTYPIAHPEYQPPHEVIERFNDWIERRACREPLAYIIGKREFFGIDFEVTPDVLIPRQETEVLVETAVNVLSGICAPVVADIGLGSGAIAVSIAKSVPDAVVYGTELSTSALEIARRNAERAGVDSQTHFLEGDLFEPLAGLRFDLIASNPPYIPSDEIDHLQPEVSKFEPRRALDGGPDGLDYYRLITKRAPEYLKPGGILAVEVGAGEAAMVEELFSVNGFSDVRSIFDYGGIERVVIGVHR